MSDHGPKIQHTEAVELCSDLKRLQRRAAALYHQLVLHDRATSVPAHKTEGQIEPLRRQMDRVNEQLNAIKAELEAVRQRSDTPTMQDYLDDGDREPDADPAPAPDDYDPHACDHCGRSFDHLGVRASKVRRKHEQRCEEADE